MLSKQELKIILLLPYCLLVWGEMTALHLQSLKFKYIEE